MGAEGLNYTNPRLIFQGYLCYYYFAMKFCPKCKKGLPDHFTQCPFDHSSLVKLGETPRRGTAGTDPLADYTLAERRPAAGKPVRSRAFLPSPSSSGGRLQQGLTTFLSLLLFGGISFSVSFLFAYYSPRHTKITVKSVPAGAKVFFDDKRIGITPFEGKSVPLGGHRLRIVKEGFYETSRMLVLREGVEEKVREVLEPISGKALSEEDSRRLEEWVRLTRQTMKERILFPPPDDYNTVYFLRQILGLDPNHTFALETRKKLSDDLLESAENAYQRGNTREAERYYAHYLQLQPDDTLAQVRLEQLRQGIQRDDETRRQTMQLLSANIEKAFAAGKILPPGEGNAYDLLRQLIRFDPRGGYTRSVRARFQQHCVDTVQKLSAEENWTEVQKVLSVAVEFSPENKSLQAQLDSVRQKIDQQRRAAAEDAETQRLHRQRLSQDEIRLSAISAYRSERYEQAIQLVQQLAQITEPDEDMRFLLGMSLLRQKQYRQAIQAFQECLGQNARRADAHIQIGLIYQTALKDSSRAEGHFQKALQLGGTSDFGPTRLQNMIQSLRQEAGIEQRMNQPTEVEHQHAFGSCRGRVIWGLVTMQFWSDEKAHNFIRPYAQIKKFAQHGNVVEIQFADKKYNFRVRSQSDLKWVMQWLAQQRMNKG